MESEGSQCLAMAVSLVYLSELPEQLYCFIGFGFASIGRTFVESAFEALHAAHIHPNGDDLTYSAYCTYTEDHHKRLPNPEMDDRVIIITPTWQTAFLAGKSGRPGQACIDRRHQWWNWTPLHTLWQCADGDTALAPQKRASPTNLVGFSIWLTLSSGALPKAFARF
jgi:hypothetical protein